MEAGNVVESGDSMECGDAMEPVIEYARVSSEGHDGINLDKDKLRDGHRALVADHLVRAPPSSC
jgi:hypothetical protein